MNFNGATGPKRLHLAGRQHTTHFMRAGVVRQAYVNRRPQNTCWWSPIRTNAVRCPLGVGAAVADRLARSHPTKTNRVQSPAGSPTDFRMWESWQTMPLVGGFSRGSHVFPVLSFRRCSIITSIILIGSQDVAVKSRPCLFPHSPFGALVYATTLDDVTVLWRVAKRSGIFLGHIDASGCRCNGELMHVFVLMEGNVNIPFNGDDKLSHMCNKFLYSSYCSRCSVVVLGVVWFKNRRAKCRQQQKQHQQQQQHQQQNGGSGGGGGDKARSTAGGGGGASGGKAKSGGVSACAKSPPPVASSSSGTPGSSTGSPPSAPPPPLAAPAPTHSPGGGYAKPLLGSPPSANPAAYNASIWSPASIDSCLDRGGGGGYSGLGAGVAQAASSNCYPPPHQNYGAYYTNMDYLGPASAMQHSQLNVSGIFDERLSNYHRLREVIIMLFGGQQPGVELGEEQGGGVVLQLGRLGPQVRRTAPRRGVATPGRLLARGRGSRKLQPRAPSSPHVPHAGPSPWFITQSRAAVAERLACSHPTKANRVQSRLGHFRFFACGNRVG
ncbi:hypothetical protein PR048_004404 [Dryococelus australis]|uniref:Uncharacterized protein n=1 Tax=Dryococelus australis TaxID=614101 RepID=A0ABQ9I6C8_9NEOP|nr:hypothetical protein PR048_004404 [Dryococelus australis]